MLKRRQFLKSTAAGIALLGLPEIARPAATSPEVDLGGISLGVIGLGPRGHFLLEQFQKHCPVRAVCDVHRDRIGAAAARCSGEPLCFGDYREMLASKEISGVVIATPDNWHARMTLDAIRAGKHVFCETPACRTLGEARSLIELKNPGNLKIQAGCQGRANSAAFAACRYLREGQAGKIHTVRLWSAADEPFKPSAEHSDTPPGLDWPFWLGPLKPRAFDAALYAGGWRWVAEIGGGHLVSRGSQLLTLLQWFLDRELDGQIEVEPVLGLGGEHNHGDAPRSELTFNFKNAGIKCVWETKPKSDERIDWGMQCIGAKGQFTMLGGSEDCQVSHEVFGYQPAKAFMDPSWAFAPDLRLNWLQSIAEAKQPTMPLGLAARAAAVVLVGKLARQLNRRLVWDFDGCQFVNDPEANRLRQDAVGGNPWADEIKPAR